MICDARLRQPLLLRWYSVFFLPIVFWGCGLGYLFEKGVGLKLFQDGEYEEATEHLLAAIRGGAEDAQVVRTLGQAYHYSGAYEDAILVFERYIEQYPDDPAGRIALARVYLDIGVPESSVVLVERVLRSDSTHAEACLVMGRAQLDWGDSSLAERYYRRGLGRDLHSYREYAEICNDLGLLEYDRRNFRKALQLFDSSSMFDPGWGDPRRNAGLMLEQEGDLWGAIRAYWSANAMQDLGRVYLRAGDKEMAVSSYRRAVEGDPQNADCRYELADLLDSLGSHAEAIEEWDDILELWPDWSEAHYRKGQSLREQGDIPEAARELSVALHLSAEDPGNGEEWMRELVRDIRTEIGSMLLDSRLTPDCAPSLTRAGRAYLMLGRENDAIECLSKAAAWGDVEAREVLTGLEQEK